MAPSLTVEVEGRVHLRNIKYPPSTKMFELAMYVVFRWINMKLVSFTLLFDINNKLSHSKIKLGSIHLVLKIS